MTPPNIPLFYRLWHLYLEPLAALGGTYHLHSTPEQYFDYMPPTAQYSPQSQIVCDQLAATYLLFAFIEGVVLRVTDDIRIWKYIIFGLALCDAGHVYSSWREIGTEWIFSPWMWDQKDFITNILNVVPLLTRLAFLSEVGYSGRVTAKEKI